MTARVHVSVDIPAAQQAVWDDVSVLTSHVEWMGDAEAIGFVTDRHEGVGTAFDCVTRIGPIRVVDRMTVTEWDEPWRIGIRHDGHVTGHGQFTLAAIGAARTRFRWDESLVLPWWLGGRIAGPLAAYVLGRVWRANLRRLARRFTAAS